MTSLAARSSALMLVVLAMACGGDDAATGTETDATTSDTDASATDPSATDPSATDPSATDPSATDPSATDPSATDSTDDSATDPTDPSSSSAESSSSVDSSGTDGSSSTSDDGSSTTAEPTTDGSSSSDDGGNTTGEPADLEAYLVDVGFYQDCQPEVAPDPLQGYGWIDLDNSGGDVTAVTVVSARFLEEGVEVATMEITPTDLGPVDAGDYVSVAWDKVTNSLLPALGCNTLDCSTEYQLEVVLDVDGAYAVAVEDIYVDCVF